jgi:hypothetical protein
MAKFLKTGNTVLNLDAIQSVVLDALPPGSIVVNFPAGHHTLRGAEAEAFRTWIELAAVDALKAPSGSQGG